MSTLEPYWADETVVLHLGDCIDVLAEMEAGSVDAICTDPFAGSGTTAEACIVEGFRCVLIEKDPAYAELIRTRLRKPIQPAMFGDAS